MLWQLKSVRHKLKKRVKGIINSVLIILLAAASVIFLVYLTKGRSEVDEGYRSPTYFAMDTTLEICIKGMPEKISKKIAREVFLWVKELERRTSRFLEKSDVSEVNRNAGVSRVKVSPDTFQMVKESIKLSEMTEGAFDITVAPLMEIYGFYSHPYRIPKRSEIDRNIKLVGWKYIELDRKEKTIMLTKPGMQIDLGGIAKGYAIEKIIRMMKNRGVKRGFVNFGGAIGVLSIGQDIPSWTIGIRDPRGKPEDVLGTLSLKEGYVSSSGDYERYFIKNKRRYFHILDPRTGKCPDKVISATVVGPEGALADAMSTAIIVMGRSKGMGLVRNLPGYEAVVVEKGKEVFYTIGMKKKFALKIDWKLR